MKDYVKKGNMFKLYLQVSAVKGYKKSVNNKMTILMFKLHIVAVV